MTDENIQTAGPTDSRGAPATNPWSQSQPGAPMSEGAHAVALQADAGTLSQPSPGPDLVSRFHADVLDNHQVSSRVGMAAVEFLNGIGSGFRPEPVRHHFDLDLSRASPQDQAVATVLLNRLSAAGASEAEAGAVLMFIAKAAGYSDRADFSHKKHEFDGQHAEAALRARWGSQYETRVKAVQAFAKAHPDKAPADVELDNGTLSGNDPDYVQGVWRHALAEEAGVDVEGQIAAYEHRMRTDRAGWMNDTGAQKAYRNLLRIRNDDPYARIRADEVYVK